MNGLKSVIPFARVTLCGGMLAIGNKSTRTGPEQRCELCPGPNPRITLGGFRMSTPLPGDDAPVAPGWRCYDLRPMDIAHLLPRFYSKFTPGAPDDCWEWQGSKHPNGYGFISQTHRAKTRGGLAHLLAHRVAWVAATGLSLRDQLTIDHLCFNKLCVNPRHLEPVTHRENIRRRRPRNKQEPRREDCPYCGKNLLRPSMPGHLYRLHPAEFEGEV